MKRGHPPMPSSVVRRFGMLMQIHVLTHPERVARRYGISAEYVRKQWRDLARPDLAYLMEVMDSAFEDAYWQTLLDRLLEDKRLARSLSPQHFRPNPQLDCA